MIATKTMINRTVLRKYVVCVEGSRVRVLDKTPDQPVPDEWFTPGVLLTVVQSRPYLKAMGK